MQCQFLQQDIPSIYYKGALIPSETVCKLITNAIQNRSSIDQNLIKAIQSYLPPSSPSRSAEPSPNVLLWGGYNAHTTEDGIHQYYDKILGYGSNTLQASMSYLLCQNPLTAQSDDSTIDRIIRMKGEYGLPIHLNANFGIYYMWNESPGASVIYRVGYAGSNWNTTGPYGPDAPWYNRMDPCAAEIEEVYHSNLITMAATKGGFKELIDFQHDDPLGAWAYFNMASEYAPSRYNETLEGVTHVNYSRNTGAMLCPNYRGDFHINAVNKHKEMVKWLEPIAIVYDMEHYTNPYYADWYMRLFSHQYDGQTLSYDTLSDCALCAAAGEGDGALGHYRGLNGITAELNAIVKSYQPNAKCMHYDVYNGQRSPLRWGWGFDMTSGGFTHSQPEFYSLSYNLGEAGCPTTDPDYPDALSDRFYYWREHQGSPFNQGYGDNLSYRAQPEALSNSYPIISQFTHAFSMELSFLTNEQMYDLCYTFAREGALGFECWPAWTGTSTETDAAADRLIPIGIQAFRDYRRLYG